MIKAKRLLAILIAVSMSCSFGVIGISAANDTEASDETEVQAKTETYAESETVQEESIPAEIRKKMNVLKAFNIIPEYYDYNVPLTYEVSRSDFAVSVANMMDKAKYDGSEVYFYDVPKNYWAYNEISNLAEMGILNGSGDKTFNPGDPITKSAAYKMLLCAMGYREYAERSGGYPIGYTSVAGKIKLSRGVSGSENVTMSDMLQILYNSLTINILELGDFVENAMTYRVSEKETLISSYRYIYYDEGDVNGANSVTISGGGLNKDIALIGNEKYNSNGFNMMDYLGERIEFFYEQKDSSDRKTLLWVGRKDDVQDIRTVSVDGDAHLDTDTFIYTYYENGGMRRITLDRSTLLVYNGEIIESGYDKILNKDKYELKVISNDGKYTLIIRAYVNYIVGNINSTDLIVYDKNTPKDCVSLNREDYDTFSLKRMGSDDMDFEDITEDTVLTVYKSDDDRHIEVFVSNNTVNGIVEKFYTENGTKITINGNEYRVDSRFPANGYAVGDDVTAYINVYGEIVYITVNAGVYQGSFLLQAIYKEAKDILYIKQLGEDSKVSKLQCAEKILIDGKRFKHPEDAYNELLAGGSKLTPRFALIKKNADGEVTEIDTETYNVGYETVNSLQVDVPFWYGAETTYTQRLIRANANAARIGEKIVFDANTKVFIVPFVTDYDTASDEDFSVTVGSKLANDTGAYAQSYKTAKKIGITKYILLKGYDPSKVNAELPIVAQKIVTGLDDEGNIVEILKGYQGVSPVSIMADDTVSDLFSSKGVFPGAIVTLKKDTYGNIKDCTIAYDYRTNIHKALTATNDVLGMFVGYANDVVDNVVKIGYESGADYDFAINAMSKPVLVFDKSATKDPISVATTGDIVTYSNSITNCSTVFIVTSRMQPQMFVIFK